MLSFDSVMLIRFRILSCYVCSPTINTLTYFTLITHCFQTISQTSKSCLICCCSLSRESVDPSWLLSNLKPDRASSFMPTLKPMSSKANTWSFAWLASGRYKKIMSFWPRPTDVKILHLNEISLIEASKKPKSARFNQALLVSCKMTVPCCL